MATLWETPFYPLTAKSGKKIVVDVTSSVSPGSPPNKVFGETLIAFFKEKGVERIVDFGAGALRHTFPLLGAGFQVCAVEFEEQFKKLSCSEALQKAELDANFSKLIWPGNFKKDRRRFDAALLCYVVQTMPDKDEREVVLKVLRKKLRDDNAYLVWMSRFGQTGGIPRSQMVRDGYFKYTERDMHSFYTEFTTEATHRMMEDFGFQRLRSLSERGTDQIFVYGRGKSTWI
jgi:hypothetical protein